MKRPMLMLGLLAVGVAFQVVAEEKHQHASPPPTNSAFEKMKSLVGTWVAADNDGKPTDQVVSVIRLTAGGSVLHETLFPGQPHEMVSIYTVDGPDVVMTHYCMLGNQPQMKAKANSTSNKLTFEFIGGTNFNPAKDKHMHSAVLTFIDDNRFEVEGIGWEGGKPAKEMCGGLKLVRKK